MQLGGTFFFTFGHIFSAGVPSPRNEVLLHVFPHIPTEPGQNEHLAPTQDEPNAAFRFGDWKLLTGHIGKDRTN